jgi:16S rRNA (cytosine967-C5)-methyltransferase
MRQTDIAAFATRQREIMAAALDLAAPGARVVYATCSLLRAENEDVAQSLAGVELQSLSDVLGDRAAQLGGEAFTVAPHTHGTDGFYARIMRRT